MSVHGLGLPEFADRVNEFLPIIMREVFRRQKNELSKGNITLPQFVVLAFLEKQNGEKMTEIARFMGVTTPAATGIVERLVKCGYAVRIPGEADRRVVQVRLTVKGVEVVKKITRQRRQMIMEVFGELSQQERDQYVSILTHINENLDIRRKAAAG